MSDIATFRIGQRVRIVSVNRSITREQNLSNGSTGVIVGTLTISPGYYDICLDGTEACCIVHATNLEAVAPQSHEHA